MSFHVHMFHIAYLSIHQAARVKSIPITTICETDLSKYPTYRDMTMDRNIKRNSLHFISVPYNVGSTTHVDRAQAAVQKQSFGCPRFFFRLNVTSAVNDELYAFVDWCCFKATTFTVTCFQGEMTQEEWTTGPSYKQNLNPFVTMDDITPSRFVLAYDDTHDILDVGFLSMDPERIGDIVDDGIFIDFGNNVLSKNKREFLRRRM